MKHASIPNNWSPTSWRSFEASQQPTYKNNEALESVLAELGQLPPIVTSWEVESLKKELARAQNGDAFVLQGGDCSENFEECKSEVIVKKLKILLQMSLIMMMGMEKPIVRIGRMAGQYAKPRSENMESRGGVSLPSYRGDLINRPPFKAEDREPDAKLMLRGYERAALTLNFVRSLIDGGFADLHHPENWDLKFASKSPMASEYHKLVDSVTTSLGFFESVTGKSIYAQRIEFYVSHEGLHLPYEQAQTRFLSHRDGWYNLSTHFPWVGMRTADVRGAHIEYFRGLANPIGVKIGCDFSEKKIQALIKALNPDSEPGRLTFITRFGSEQIEEHLPRAIKAVKKIGADVLWICDPMHGNTERTAKGYKTRHFDRILSELRSAFRIHRDSGSYLGGVHLELTGENVTECIGGARGLKEADLARAYKSQVDPRLNYEQAIEIAMLIARRLRAQD